jgi:hypothetical protein
MIAALLVAVTAAVAAGPAPAPTEKKVETLPTLTNSPYAGKYAVYQHAKFTAWLDAKGMLWVQPLDNHKPVGAAFQCLCVQPYYNDVRGGCPGRPIHQFEDPPAPVVIPATGGKVRLKGWLIEDIPFKVEYEFMDNTIRAAGGCADKPSITPPTNFRLMASFNQLPMLNPQTATLDQIKAATQGMTLEARRKTGPKPNVVIRYGESISEFFGPFETITVRGVFGPRVINFKPHGSEGALCGWIYQGFAPWRGWIVQYITQGQKINLSQNEARLTIE